MIKALAFFGIVGILILIYKYEDRPKPVKVGWVYDIMLHDNFNTPDTLWSDSLIVPDMTSPSVKRWIALFVRYGEIRDSLIKDSLKRHKLTKH